MRVCHPHSPTHSTSHTHLRLRTHASAVARSGLRRALAQADVGRASDFKTEKKFFAYAVPMLKGEIKLTDFASMNDEDEYVYKVTSSDGDKAAKERLKQRIAKRW